MILHGTFYAIQFAQPGGIIMKNEILHLAADMLSPEEQDLLERLSELGDEDGLALALDMDIRSGMCGALADMGEAVRSLLSLLARSRFPASLSDHLYPAYNEIMERIGSAARSADKWVNRSRILDRNCRPAAWPEDVSKIPQ
jgi:hypothetical protein